MEGELKPEETRVSLVSRFHHHSPVSSPALHLKESAAQLYYVSPKN